MKKHSFPSFVAGLVALLIGASLTSCQPSSSETSSLDQEDDTTISYATFEDWAPDFQLIRVERYAGSISVNTDPQYSAGGKGQSCLIRPVGSYSAKSSARFIFPTYSSVYHFDYRDFSSVQSLSFDFFNAEDKDIQVSLGLVPTIASIDTYSVTASQWQTLPSKQWTTLSYQVNQTALGFLYDVTNIAGFYIEFENLGSRDVALAPHLYLDNIAIHKYLVAPPIGEGLRIEGMNYLDFENSIESEAVTMDGPSVCKPEGKIVKASDVGLTAPSGDHIYQMTFKPGERNDGSRWAWWITSNVVTRSSLLATLPFEQAKDLVLEGDFYNDTDETQYLEFDFLYYSEAIFHSLMLPAKQWRHFTFAMRPVLEKYGEDFCQQGVLRVVCSEYIGDQNKQYYVDNFHFAWAVEVHPGTLAE